MTQYFTSFDDTPGLAEAGWHDADGSYTIETSGLPSGASDGAALKVVMTTDSRYAIDWTDAGDPSGVDVEFLAKWQWDTSDTDVARMFLYGSGDSTSEQAYFVTHAVTGAAATQSLSKYVSATPTVLGSEASRTLNTSTWYWTRLQVSGTTVRYRTWADGGSEPGTWDVSVTDSAITSGWFGVGSFGSAGVLWVDKMGAGTSGDAAPSSAPGTTGIIQGLQEIGDGVGVVAASQLNGVLQT